MLTPLHNCALPTLCPHDSAGARKCRREFCMQSQRTHTVSILYPRGSAEMRGDLSPVVRIDRGCFCLFVVVGLKLRGGGSSCYRGEAIWPEMRENWWRPKGLIQIYPHKAFMLTVVMSISMSMGSDCLHSVLRLGTVSQYPTSKRTCAGYCFDITSCFGLLIAWLLWHKVNHSGNRLSL